MGGAPEALPRRTPSIRNRASAGVPEGIDGGLRALLLGLALAPVFLLTPYLKLVGWFLGALAHELGHTVVGWVAGQPSLPAISLGAEAATVHGETSTFLAFVMLVAGCGLAATFLEGRLRNGVLAGWIVVQLTIAWTPVGEVVHLVGGHAGELAFGAVCLYRAWTSRDTSGETERVLYGVVGFHFVLQNARLGLGLAFSEGARATYRGNGSFGLRNDYVRLAEDVLGWPLGTVGLVAALPALALGVLAFWPALRGWIGR